MNLFQTLLRPDKEDEPERAEVARAANLLQVGEFQLLQLAYKDWFGRELPEAMVDRLFASYMLRNRVPQWARQYARNILRLEERGELDDSASKFHRYDNDYQTRNPRGMRSFLLVACVIVVFLGGAIGVSHFAAAPGTSILPPYFDREDVPD